MDRNSLINRVKSLIDEISVSGDIIEDIGIENTKPYDEIIEALLDDSALEVLLKAPFYRLKITEYSVSGIANNSDITIGHIVLPDDFLRLVEFKMEEWQRPVATLAIKGDEIASIQFNKYLRGGVAKPVGVLSKKADGMMIEYYSVIVSHNVSYFTYIKKEPAENITNEQMISALCWICAGKTLSTLGLEQRSKLCYENANSLML